MAKSNGPPAILVKNHPSQSSDSIHEVRISRTDGKLYCTCRGWRFKKSCIHTQDTTLEEVLDALERACTTGILGI